MSAWLLAVVLAGPCLEAPATLAGNIGLGVDSQPASTGDGRELGALFLLGAAYARRVCDVPLRAEVGLTATSLDAPLGAGVDAVKSARLRLDLEALAGVSLGAALGPHLAGGVDLLVGPSLRYDRRSVTVDGEGRSANQLTPRLAAAPGVYLEGEGLRLTLRLHTSVGAGATNLGGALGLAFAL